MVVVSYSGKEINAKIVYYGPGLGGKTTNLEQIYESVPAAHKGKMISMKTKADRTLFFDFLPIDLGDISGFRTRFMLYTVPGQVYYNATRKLVLKGVDAVVFVADSERGKMRENQESLENLRDNLRDYGIDINELPVVFQYNKRDLRDVYTTDELDAGLGRDMQPMIEAVAAEGPGVLETLREVSALLLRKLRRELVPVQSTGAGAANRGVSPGATERATPARPAPAGGPPATPAAAPPEGLEVTVPDPGSRERQLGAEAASAAPPEPTPSAPTPPPAASPQQSPLRTDPYQQPSFDRTPFEQHTPEQQPTPRLEVMRFGDGVPPAPAPGGAPVGSPAEQPVESDPERRPETAPVPASSGGEVLPSDTARRFVVPIEIDLDRVQAGESLELVIEIRAASSGDRRVG
jgi:signal recognition particle receptor subunit beta